MSVKRPANVKSALLNFVLLLVVSGISLGLLFVEKIILEKADIFPSARTASFVIPSKGEYTVGDTFKMDLEIAGTASAINTVIANLRFDPAVLKVVDISTADSFATIFLEKEINNTLGYARIAGGLPNPGFNGEKGIFATVYFGATAPGVTQVELLSSSAILANDGKGTDILRTYPKASYLILAGDEATSERSNSLKIEPSSSVLGDATSLLDQIHLYDPGKVYLDDESIELVSASYSNNVGVDSLVDRLPIYLYRFDSFVISMWDTLLH